MQECVIEAIKTYPFSELERKIVNYDKSDFTFFGNKEIVVHILFNLINNALYFLGNHSNPQILIWFSSTPDNNLVHFKDNGTGISVEQFDQIFKAFYTQSKNGTGLGLSFSKMAMTMMSGDILCKSVKEEFTEIILKFPKYY